MARKEAEKRVAVTDRRRIDVNLGKEEVEHALRCWVDHGPIRGAHRLPPPEDFSKISVSVWSIDGEDAFGATVSYDAKRVPEPIILYPASDWNEEDGETMWWAFPISEAPYVGSPLASNWPFGDGYMNRGDLRWQRIIAPIIEGGDQNAFGG